MKCRILFQPSKITKRTVTHVEGQMFRWCASSVFEMSSFSRSAQVTIHIVTYSVFFYLTIDGYLIWINAGSTLVDKRCQRANFSRGVCDMLVDII